MPNWLFSVLTKLNILMYVPSSKTVDNMANKPVSAFWNTPGPKGDAERNVIKFYYGLSPYMKTGEPVGTTMRKMITWVVNLLYSFDLFLENIYIHMFAILGLGSNTSIHGGTSAGSDVFMWYKYGQAFGLVLVVGALIWYFFKMIISPNGYAIEETKRAMWTMVLVGFTVCSAPMITGTITNGLGQFAKDAFHQERVTQGSMVNDTFYDNVYSVPHMLMDKSAGKQITVGGNGVNSLGGNHIRHVPGTRLNSQVPVRQLIINLQGMNTTGPNGQNRWNGLHETSIPSFLQAYGSDDDVLDSQGLQDLSGQAVKTVNKKHGKMSKQKYNKLKYKPRENKLIAQDEQDKRSHEHFKGVQDAWDDLAEMAHENHYSDEMQSHDETGYTTKSIQVPADYTFNNDGLLSYGLTGTGSNTRIIPFKMGTSSPLHGVHDFYTMYKVNWFNIICTLVLIAYVFIAFISKIVVTMFKTTVMYSTIGITAYKGLTDPQKWKQYIRNYYNLFEMLVFDVIMIILWFDSFRFIGAVINDWVAHSIVPNLTVANVLINFCGFILANTCVGGIQRLSNLLGAPSGSRSAFGRAIGAVMLANNGLGLATRGTNMVRSGVSAGGTAIAGVGKGISKGAGVIKSGSAHHKMGMGPLQRAKRAHAARKANGDTLSQHAHNLLHHDPKRAAKKASKTNGKTNKLNDNARNPSKKNGVKPNADVSKREARSNEKARNAKNRSSHLASSSINGNNDTNPADDDSVKGADHGLVNGNDNSSANSSNNAFDDNSNNGNPTDNGDNGNEQVNGEDEQMNADDNSDNGSSDNENTNPYSLKSGTSGNGTNGNNDNGSHQKPTPSNKDQKAKAQRQMNKSAAEHNRNPAKSNGANQTNGHKMLDKPIKNNQGVKNRPDTDNTYGTKALNGIQHTGNGVTHVGNALRHVGGRPSMRTNPVNHGEDANINGTVGRRQVTRDTNGSNATVTSPDGDNQTDNSNPTSDDNGNDNYNDDDSGMLNTGNQPTNPTNNGNGGNQFIPNGAETTGHQQMNNEDNALSSISGNGNTGNTGTVNAGNINPTNNGTNFGTNSNPVNTTPGDTGSVNIPANGGINNGADNGNVGNSGINSQPEQNFASEAGIPTDNGSTTNVDTNDVNGGNNVTDDGLDNNYTSHVQGSNPFGTTHNHHITQQVDDDTDVTQNDNVKSPIGNTLNNGKDRENYHVTRVHNHHTNIHHHNQFDPNADTFGYSQKPKSDGDIDFGNLAFGKGKNHLHHHTDK